MAAQVVSVSLCDASLPITPTHTPHQSLSNTPSRSKTPVHTLSLHEYRKQQRSPIQSLGEIPRGLKRRPATPHLNPDRPATTLPVGNTRSALAPLPHLQNRSLTVPPPDPEDHELRKKITVIDLRSTGNSQTQSTSLPKVQTNRTQSANPTASHLHPATSSRSLKRKPSARHLRSPSSAASSYSSESAHGKKPSVFSASGLQSPGSNTVATTFFKADGHHADGARVDEKGFKPVVGALHILAGPPRKSAYHRRESTGESFIKLLSKGARTAPIPANAFIFEQPFGFPERPADLPSSTSSVLSVASSDEEDCVRPREIHSQRLQTGHHRLASVTGTEAHSSNPLASAAADASAIPTSNNTDSHLQSPFKYDDVLLKTEQVEQKSVRTPKRNRSPHSSILLSSFLSPAKSDILADIGPVTTSSTEDLIEDIAEDPFTDDSISEAKFEPRIPVHTKSAISAPLQLVRTSVGDIHGKNIDSDVSRLSQCSSNSSLPRIPSLPLPARNPERLQRSPLNSSDPSPEILYAHEESYFSISSLLESSSRKSSFQRPAPTSHSRFDSAQTGTAQEDLDSFYLLYRDSSERTSASLHSRKRLPRPDGSRTETSSVSSKSQVQVHHHGTSFDLVNPHKSLDLEEVADESDGEAEMWRRRRLTSAEREDEGRREKTAREIEKAALKQQTTNGQREMGLLRPLSQMLHLTKFPDPAKAAEAETEEGTASSARSRSPLEKATSTERFEASKFRFPPSDDLAIPEPAFSLEDEHAHSRETSSIINHYASLTSLPADPDTIAPAHLPAAAFLADSPTIGTCASGNTADLLNTQTTPLGFDPLNQSGQVQAHVAFLPARPKKAHTRPSPLKPMSAFIDRTVAASQKEDELGWHRFSMTPRLRRERGQEVDEKGELVDEWTRRKKARRRLCVLIWVVILVCGSLGVGIGVGVGVVRRSRN